MTAHRLPVPAAMLRHAVLLLTTALILVPFVWMVSLSLKPRDDIADLANEQLLALDEHGRIIGANHAAFVAYQQERGIDLLGNRIDQLLPANVDELLSLTQGGARGVRLRTLQDEALVDIGLRTPASPPPRSVPNRIEARPDDQPLLRAEPDRGGVRALGDASGAGQLDAELGGGSGTARPVRVDPQVDPGQERLLHDADSRRVRQNCFCEWASGGESVSHHGGYLPGRRVRSR